MSILSMEYDVEVAKRVYGEELLEDTVIEMIKMGLSKEQISRATKFSIEKIQQIEADFSLTLSSNH